MARRKDIVDLPLITDRQAAALFGWSQRKFKKKFDEVLHKEIATGKTSYSVGYLLTDVLRAAYPEANNTEIHLMAIDVCYREAATRRKSATGRRRNSERGKDK